MNAPSPVPPLSTVAARTVVQAAVLAIDAYKLVLSPFFAGTCRFEPSCSAYAREALVTHGAPGILLAARRLARCRPYGGAGFDPVPEPRGEGARASP